MIDDVIKKHGLLIIFFVLLFSVIFYEGGVFSYIKMRVELRRINKETIKLEQENIALSKEIDRLRKDDQYLEEVVRKKYGLLREGERLYRIER